MHMHFKSYMHCMISHYLFIEQPLENALKHMTTNFRCNKGSANNIMHFNFGHSCYNAS